MKKKIITLFLGVFMTCFLFSTQTTAQSILPVDGFYYIKVDTTSNGSGIGYLRMDSLINNRVIVDNTVFDATNYEDREDYALWKFVWKASYEIPVEPEEEEETEGEGSEETEGEDSEGTEGEGSEGTEGEGSEGTEGEGSEGTEGEGSEGTEGEGSEGTEGEGSEGTEGEGSEETEGEGSEGTDDEEPVAPKFMYEYYIVNKKTLDTLIFDIPMSDTIAVLNPGGVLKEWIGLRLDDEVGLDSIKLSSVEGVYYLTLDDKGGVRVSPSTTKLKSLQFTVEQLEVPAEPVLPPDTNYYRLLVDTILDSETTVVDSVYLRLDIGRTDSLVVNTLPCDDLSLWEFVVDTTIVPTDVPADTTYYKIVNKETKDTLAFNMPVVANDTIAYVATEGVVLNLWGIPTGAELGDTITLVLRDTLNDINYFLGIKADTTVFLVRDTASAVATDIVKYLSFTGLLEEKEPLPVEPPIEYSFDSTQVYMIQHVLGVDSGKYIGVNAFGEFTLLDSVYAHVPDGQFVSTLELHSSGPEKLINRTGKTIDPFGYIFITDEANVVIDTLKNRYTYGLDTVEVKPVIGVDKRNPIMGYKYYVESDLKTYDYYFEYSNQDSLLGRVLGADTAVALLPENLKAMFTLENVGIERGASEVGGIASLARTLFQMRSKSDPTLYLSASSPSEMTNNSSDAGKFYLKESDSIGLHYIVPVSAAKSKFIVDTISKQLIHADIDTTAYSMFNIVQTGGLKPEFVPEEEGSYKYLAGLNELEGGSGIGLYEISYRDANRGWLWLSKDWYDMASFAKEGESMLRAGSYTPHDFRLWLDTARGTGFNSEMPSFYIIKDADTDGRDVHGYGVSGYFLHVMDSTLLSPQNDYVITDDDDNEHRYNRLNFVWAKRDSADRLLLNVDPEMAVARDSVGFEGKNENAINEFRFYLQVVDSLADAEDMEYYIVTELGYGSTENPGVRGYLSMQNGVLYVGPRSNLAHAVVIKGSQAVSNEVLPPVIKEVEKTVTIIGESGQLVVKNAMGQQATVFNIVGQQIADRVLSSDNEVIPVSRGIVIVKVGASKTQKVIVK